MLSLSETVVRERQLSTGTSVTDVIGLGVVIHDDGQRDVVVCFVMVFSTTGIDCSK